MSKLIIFVFNYNVSFYTSLVSCNRDPFKTSVQSFHKVVVIRHLI